MRKSFGLIIETFKSNCVAFLFMELLEDLGSGVIVQMTNEEYLEFLNRSK
jgi:hypothetical protein